MDEYAGNKDVFAEKTTEEFAALLESGQIKQGDFETLMQIVGHSAPEQLSITEE